MREDKGEREFRLWEQWWFWLLTIPLAGVLVPIFAMLPVKAWWFWMIVGLGSSSIARVLRGGPYPSRRLERLEREVKQLRAALAEKGATPALAPEPALSPQEARALASELAPQGVAVILFSDIEGFTRLVDRLGDETSHSVLLQHHRLLRRAFARHGGREVKQLNDGFMVSFSSAKRALLCADEIQQRLERFNENTGHDLRVRIGIHAGEPLREGDGFVGQTVNLARRVMEQAAGGEVLVTEVIRNLAGPLKGFQYVERGPRKLAGISEPQRLYAFQRVEALSHPLDSALEQELNALEERLADADP